MDERVSTLLDIRDDLHVEGQDTNLTVPAQANSIVNSLLLRASHARGVRLPHLEKEWANFDQAQVQLDLCSDQAKEFEEERSLGCGFGHDLGGVRDLVVARQG